MSDQPLKSVNARVITMSDSRSSGERVDTVGPMLVAELSKLGAVTENPIVIPDEKTVLIETLLKLADEDCIDLIITTGGTGLTPRDVTPDATREVITREIPGFGELMRYEGGRHTPKAYISRGIAGIRERSLIINVPGSERGAMQSIGILLPILPHTLETIRGDSRECGKRLGESD